MKKPKTSQVFPNSRLIAIDTLQKILTASKDNTYANDYRDRVNIIGLISVLPLFEKRASRAEKSNSFTASFRI